MQNTEKKNSKTIGKTQKQHNGQFNAAQYKSSPSLAFGFNEKFCKNSFLPISVVGLDTFDGAGVHMILLITNENVYIPNLQNLC